MVILFHGIMKLMTVAAIGVLCLVSVANAQFVSGCRAEWRWSW
jgi:hypothetical protein